MKKGNNETIMSYINRVSEVKDAMLHRKRLDLSTDLTQRESSTDFVMDSHQSLEAECALLEI